jgi:hypothetical protein
MVYNAPGPLSPPHMRQLLIYQAKVAPLKRVPRSQLDLDERLGRKLQTGVLSYWSGIGRGMRWDRRQKRRGDIRLEKPEFAAWVVGFQLPVRCHAHIAGPK